MLEQSSGHAHRYGMWLAGTLCVRQRLAVAKCHAVCEIGYALAGFRFCLKLRPRLVPFLFDCH